MLTAKVTKREITKTGKVLFTLNVTTKPAGKDPVKEPAVEKEARCIMEMAQIQMAKELGSNIPVANATVLVEFQVNPTSGLESDEWCSIAL